MNAVTKLQDDNREIDQYAELSLLAITKCVDALRHLQGTFGHGLRIDAIDMEIVDRALTRVDVELSCQRVNRLNAEASVAINQIAAE